MTHGFGWVALPSIVQIKLLLDHPLRIFVTHLHQHGRTWPVATRLAVKFAEASKHGISLGEHLDFRCLANGLSVQLVLVALCDTNVL